MPGTRTPKLRHQLGERRNGKRGSLRWFVQFGTRRVHLGSGGSKSHPPAEVEAAYNRALAEWIAAGRRLPTLPDDDISVNELVAAYLEFARREYRKDGRLTSTYDGIRSAVRHLVALYGETPVSAFGPLRLKAVREQMVGAGWSRTTVNNSVSRIKRICSWGVENELIPPGIAGALREVASLRKDRTEAPDNPPTESISRDDIATVKKQLPSPVAALIDLQLLTAARPSEVLGLRAKDIKKSKKVWEAEVSGHKTEHHGDRRFLRFNSEAVAILETFMDGKGPDDYLFSPRDAYRERRKGKGARRSNQQESPRKSSRRMGDHYTTDSYRRAIQRACDDAFPHPKLADIARPDLTERQRDQLREWRKQHRWHPHQIRHTALTEIEREHGIEAARAVAGHKTIRMTDHYVEQDRERAVAAVHGRTASSDALSQTGD